MNILIITVYYPPEIRSCSHLMCELADELSERGHNVTVGTTHPKYQLLESYEGKGLSDYSVENNIKVIRIHTPPVQSNYLVKGMSQLTLPFLFSRHIKKHVKDSIDTIIVYSPPLTLALAGKMLKKTYGAKLILNVQDIFPQNAIDLGILKHRPLIKFFELIEKTAYASSDYITAHSESNRKFLCFKKNVPAEKLVTLHNWIDTALYQGTNSNGTFRKKYGLKSKFIFLFAGFMGVSQDLDLIIKIAKDVKHINDIRFLLVGDGPEKNRLAKAADELSLENVVFKPFVSKDEYPHLVKESDAGIICLSSKNKTPVVPGKLLGYMAASIPVVGLLNEESDGHTIIRDAKCGYSAVSANYGKALESVISLYNEKDKLTQYGKNGFRYVSQNFEKNACIDVIENII